MKKPLVINLYAGPGTGKSTSAAQLFSELKWKGVECELVTEFAKEKVWDESFKVLDDQIYVFAKQLHKMRRLIDKVDVIITDSPLLFSLIYDKSGNKNFEKLVLDVYDEFENYNVFLRRVKNYNPNGRMQTEEEAISIDLEIYSMIEEHCDEFDVVIANQDGIKELSENILGYLNNNDDIRI